LVVAMINDALPLPSTHGTDCLYLRSTRALFDIVSRRSLVSLLEGEITEAHPPLVDEHRHGVTWCAFVKECDHVWQRSH